MEKPKKPGPGRPKQARQTVLASCRLFTDVAAALSRLAAKTRRTKSTEMALAVEEWLRKNGELPPAK